MCDITNFSSDKLAGTSDNINLSDENCRRKIRHLYRRLGYGARLEDFDIIQNEGITTFSALIDKLIGDAAGLQFPDEFDWADRLVRLPVREQPIDIPPNPPNPPHPDDVECRRPRDVHAGISGKDWFVNTINSYWINESIRESIRSKLMLFWRGHFATHTDVITGSFGAIHLKYYRILFNYAFGNFREFVEQIGLTPFMLTYLNGDRSIGENSGIYTSTPDCDPLEPTENYARELLELFTMGIKDKNGQNNYTQQDISELSRALTGWRITRYTADYKFDMLKFQYGHHDWGTKTIFGEQYNAADLWTEAGNTSSLPSLCAGDVTNDLYSREAVPYGSSSSSKIVTAGLLEYNHVHEIIFGHKTQEIAYFITKKLYEFYVYGGSTQDWDDVDKTALKTYLTNIANEFLTTETVGDEAVISWDISAVLKKLFKSQHFYDEGIIGTQIKSHIGSAISLFRKTNLQPQWSNYNSTPNTDFDYTYRMTLLYPSLHGMPSPICLNGTSPTGDCPEIGDNQVQYAFTNGKADTDYDNRYTTNNGKNCGGYAFTEYAENPNYLTDGTINAMTAEGALPEDAKNAYEEFKLQDTLYIHGSCAVIGHSLRGPADVSGWAGHRDWLNEEVFVKRRKLLGDFLTEKFGAHTKEKFRQLVIRLLEEEEDVNNMNYIQKYATPERVIRMMWRHFFSVEPYESEVNGTAVGQVVDSIKVYSDGFNYPVLIVKPEDEDFRNDYPFLNDNYIEEYKVEMANRITNVILYFTQQPEWHLT